MDTFLVAVCFADGDNFRRTFHSSVSVRASGPLQATLLAEQMVMACHPDVHVQITSTVIVSVLV